MSVILVLSNGHRFLVEDKLEVEVIVTSPRDIHFLHGIPAVSYGLPDGSWLSGQPELGTPVRVNGTHVAYWYRDEVAF